MSEAISIFLPVAMMVLMLSVGFHLAPHEFLETVQRPRAIFSGLSAQMVGLPVLAYLIGTLAGLDAYSFAGLMLVAASPGGVTSNYATVLARGSVALSVSLTLVTSLVAPLSLPFVMSLTDLHAFAPGGLWRISVGMTGFAIAPLIVGMVLAHFAPKLVGRIFKLFDAMSKLLFLAMVVATFAQNWHAMGEALDNVGAAVAAYSVGALILAVIWAQLIGLNGAEARTVMVEVSLQNVAITIFVATTLLAEPALAIPGLIYAVLMNVMALGIIVWTRLVPRPVW